jgi:hypothetical protein
VPSGIAEASLALQLLGMAWRLLGQLVAVESLVFVLLRPKPLEQLHSMLAKGACSFNGALQRLGLVNSALSLGEQHVATFSCGALLCVLCTVMHCL